MSASRNLGIDGARGELIAFLDADDVWEAGHLDHDVGLLLAHPEAGMACGRALDWRSWDGGGAPDTPTPLPFAPGSVVPPPRMLTAVLRRGAYRTPTCSLLVRVAVVRGVGGAEDAFTGMFEDQALLAKLHLSAAAVVSGSLTARYRRHPGSATALAQRRGEYDPSAPNAARGAFLTWLGRRPELAAPDADADLRAALDAALAPYRRLGPVPAVRRWARRTARVVVPPADRRRLRKIARLTRPGVVRLGSWLEPVSRQFGFERGQPVDRWYIERFLAENAENVAGRVLEVGDAAYTRRFGGRRVTRSDVLNVAPGDPATTFVADLADAPTLPSGAFDCVVLTQTLHLVYDLAAAVRTLHRVLAPGGTLLATVPGISPVGTDRWAATWYWSLTPLAAERLFGEVFGPGDVEVRAWGNVLSSTAFLHGMAAGELREAELAAVDPQFPLVVGVRAFRAGAASTGFR